jgi:hypothetical protein
MWRGSKSPHCCRMRREQIVRFPGGSMTVVEHFEPEG